jgi:flavodoxin
MVFHNIKHLFLGVKMKKYLFIIALIVSSTLIACAQKNRTDNDTEIANQTQGKNMKNILIAYFSCTGNTRSLAEQIAQVSKAELYEIKPKIPYSSDDLNWRNSSSRTNAERNDQSSRPAISNNVENMEQYDVIFLGYPIWFGQAPNIIYTFLESYDFSGKTIVPFCTSGSSPIGSSASNLHKLCSNNTTWLSGSRFANNTSRSEIVKWINGLGLNIAGE